MQTTFVAPGATLYQAPIPGSALFPGGRDPDAYGVEVGEGFASLGLAGGMAVISPAVAPVRGTIVALWPLGGPPLIVRLALDLPPSTGPESTAVGAILFDALGYEDAEYCNTIRADRVERVDTVLSFVRDGLVLPLPEPASAGGRAQA